MIGTASWWEILWVLLGLGSAYYFLRSLLDAYAAQRALRRSGKNGGFLIAAQKAIRNRRNLLVSALALVGMGVIAMLIPNPTDPDISARRIIQSTIAMLMIGGLFWWARQDVESDKALDAYLESMRREAE